MMKTPVWVLAFVLWASLSPAQTEQPVRLAIVPESVDSATVADLLTAEFSGNNQVHLLERAEIDRVYREQALSAGTQDHVKLGRILGADGLLLLESPAENTNRLANPPSHSGTNHLKVRLLAVKPGVVLVAEKFLLPSSELSEWIPTFTRDVAAFLPKLRVLAKEALPISVVNLRSTVSSPEAAETERELKLLVIQHLSRQPRLFVLERQRLQRLTEEKALQSDESAFWSGSYLLEGVIDQNGFSKSALTINVRLTPPKGGAPLLFEVSGARTNLNEAVNSPVSKVTELLQVSSVNPEWTPADEAAQYFAEAQWALRWKCYEEAQAAIESAWALGKRDLGCASVRVRAYIEPLSVGVGSYQLAEYTVPSDAQVQGALRRIFAEHKSAVIGKINRLPDSSTISYSYPAKPPQAENLDGAIHVLQLYYEFCRTSPDGEPKIVTGGEGGRHDSEWYQLGVESLVAASKALQSFNLAPDAQKLVVDKLAELRALARLVADRISTAPSVHDSYFVGGRVATHDELAHSMQENNNIFRCKLNWGGYWQEKPEQQLGLYRELMSSPVFSYVHSDFWVPKPPAAHLVAWNEEDHKRVPDLWRAFVEELGNSTNVLWRMESKGLLRADAVSEDQARVAEGGWWELVRSNRNELIANNVELFYLGWGFVSSPETEAMDQEYWQKTIPARNAAGAFEQQKQYLASLTPYDFRSFNTIFQSRDYTKAHAAELLPLIAVYKSNLLAQLPPAASWKDKAKATNDVNWIGFFLEQSVNRALNPPKLAEPGGTPKPPVAVTMVRPEPTLPPRSMPSLVVSNQTVELITNALLVRKFLPIPTVGLPGDKIANVTFTSHHWFEGKLVLNFQYGAFEYGFDDKGNWKSTRDVTFRAIAILDPQTEKWQVISCPEVDIFSKTRFYHHTVLFRGEVFTSDGGQLEKFDTAKKAWQPLGIPEIGNCELFTANGRLYAATQNLIVEILEGGARMLILASNRRQPATSALDSESLGTSTLFPGPDRSLRALAANRIWGWTGTDWRTICPAPQAPTPPTISEDSILFTADGWNAPAGIWRLLNNSDQLEFCLGAAPRGPRASAQNTKPTWQPSAGMSLSGLPVASRGMDLFFMVDHAKSEDIVNEQQHLIVGKKVLARNAYHAELLCFARNYPMPQKVPLRFEAEDSSSLPVSGDARSDSFPLPNRSSGWLLFSSNHLFCGRETVLPLDAGAGDPDIKQPQRGVWIIPTEQLDSEIASQKAAQLKDQERSVALTKEAAQSLLRQYDQNHNGVIDAAERELALDNPAFIKAELDNIDTNHNGWLDPSELAWFDANQNKILDSKEGAGVALALQFLAENLLAQFDTQGSGGLRNVEYSDMLDSTLKDFQIRRSLEFYLGDTNHDGVIDLSELTGLQQRYLRLEMRRAEMRRPGVTGPMPIIMRPPMVAEPDFKATVDAFWQRPDHVEPQSSK